MIITRPMTAAKPSRFPHMRALYVVGILALLVPLGAPADQATATGPAKEIAKRVGGAWFRENFDFAAVEARITGLNLSSSDDSGCESSRCWTEISLDIVRPLGETSPNGLEAGDALVVLDFYQLIVRDGEFWYKISSTVPSNSEFWNELQLGVGDHVLLLLGRSKKSDCATPWWLPHMYETGHYAICFVRQLDKSYDSAAVITKRLGDIQGKAMGLAEGPVDANSLPRESIASEHKLDEWRLALQSFIAEVRH